MKNTIKLILAVALIATTVTLYSCRKKDDDSGYQPVGNYGNSNIVNNVFKGQLFQLLVPGPGIEMTINDPSITQTVLNNSSVSVYIQAGGGTDTVSFYVLPATIQGAAFAVSFGIGKVTITADSEPSFCIPLVNVRVVIISAARKARHPEVNFNNYVEVKKAFRLKD